MLGGKRMPKILSVSTVNPPFKIMQDDTVHLVKELFQNSFENIERLLKIFDNGQIQSRYFGVPLDWFTKEHSLKERNDLYISLAIEYGSRAIYDCLNNEMMLQQPLSCEEIEAIFFVSSTGFSTPSIEARIMNKIPFKMNTKRIPIWGLGCAGGASGLSRAYDYCLAYPSAKVLVLSIEFCSLTFQKDDHSKSNLVGTSLFADGIGCALMIGDAVDTSEVIRLPAMPSIIGTQSTLFPDSEDVMGWDVKNNGLYVIFSRDIPSIINNLLKPNVESFLNHHQMTLEGIDLFIAHPGGKKVIEAYEKALQLSSEKTAISKQILQQHGNMSSATIFYVLQAFIEQKHPPGEIGLFTALGPGFSSELLLAEWE
jgi:alkylresorcinol/alkylpyrone synthase